jgi:hypothetical protein
MMTEFWRSALSVSLCTITTGMGIQRSSNGSGGVLSMHVEEKRKAIYVATSRLLGVQVHCSNDSHQMSVTSNPR